MATSAESIPAPETTEGTQQASGGQVAALKATSLIGGSSAIVMLVRMVRTKALALILGPSGIGLEAIFDSTITLIKTGFDFGITNSGVRQIAAAAGTSDQRKIATTVYTLRRTCVSLGICAALSLIIFRNQVSRIAFGTPDYGTSFAWLSVILFMGAVSGGQLELLQGMRRIAELAKANVVGAIIGVIVSVPLVYKWGTPAIPAYMILTAAVSLGLSWHYARRVNVDYKAVAKDQVFTEAAALFRLGSAFMVSSLLSTGATFAIRSLVIRENGLPGAGEFQAANALSMVYVGFILQAMGTDFYPRLTAVASDNKLCNQAVNEQAEISLLLVVPGVLGAIALSPWVIRLFYSTQFDIAAKILAWQSVGMLMRVVSWPMGFIIVAKGLSRLIVATEVAAYSVYVALAYLGLKTIGLPGLGVAFFLLYIFHSCMMYLVVRRVSGFRWSNMNLKLIVGGALLALFVLALRLTVPDPVSSIVGAIVAAIAGIYCLKNLFRIADNTAIVRKLRRFPLIKNLAV